MSKLYYQNIPLTLCSAGALAWEAASRMVSQQGFTQAGSGDGSTFSNSGAGPVASGSTGATGLDNDEAWVRVAKTISGVLYETVFVREGGSPNSIRIYQSVGAAFTGGSPSATVRPTSTKEQALYTNAWTSGNNAYAQIVIESAAPYGIFMHAYDAGTRSHSGFFGMIPVTDADTPPGAPYVFGAGINYGVSELSSDTTTWWHYRRYGLAGEGWVNAPMLKLTSSGTTHYPNGAGNEAEDATKSKGRTIVHAVPGGLGDIGTNDWFEWPSTNASNGTLYSYASTGDRLRVGDLVLRYWNNTIPSA